MIFFESRVKIQLGSSIQQIEPGLGDHLCDNPDTTMAVFQYTETMKLPELLWLVDTVGNMVELTD